MARTNTSTGAGPLPFRGGRAHLLRAEALVELAGALAFYRFLGGGWSFLGLLFLAPDLSMLGYLANRRVGALAYNAAHTFVAPAALGLAGWLGGAPTPLRVAAIWAAHIAFDRVLGYGLKGPASFSDTHLGRIGGEDASGMQGSLDVSTAMPSDGPIGRG